ncbi:MAG: glycine betaine ABC transporter substrate-binding protein, partial [Acidimicrobiales bacterium]
FCTESDFRIRPDGLPLVEKTYGFTYPANLLHTLTLSLIYPSIAKGSTCHFGEIYTTAPQLTSDNLVVLKDPKSAFLVYNPAVNVPVSIYKKYPQLSKLFGPISAKLTTSVITHLNYEVDIKGESAATVAANWLKKEGFTA